MTRMMDIGRLAKKLQEIDFPPWIHIPDSHHTSEKQSSTVLKAMIQCVFVGLTQPILLMNAPL